MTNADSATDRPIAFALALGTLGGAALITTKMLSSRGPVGLLVYAALLLVAAAYLRLGQVRPFTRRLGMCLGAFMMGTAIFYADILLFVNPAALQIPLWGHAWRIGVMLGIGSALSAAVAQLTATRRA